MQSTSPIRRLVLVPAAPTASAPRTSVRRLLLVRPTDVLGPELLPARGDSACQGAPTRGVRAP